jgi:hypothetical protein
MLKVKCIVERQEGNSDLEEIQEKHKQGRATMSIDVILC